MTPSAGRKHRANWADRIKLAAPLILGALAVISLFFQILPRISGQVPMIYEGDSWGIIPS